MISTQDIEVTKDWTKSFGTKTFHSCLHFGLVSLLYQ